MPISKLILASASKFRVALLQQAGFAVDAIPAAADERSIQVNDATELAKQRSFLKAKDVALRCPGATVIGADQTLEFEGRAFDKPSSEEDAVKRLWSMSGQSHRLINGLYLVTASSESSEVRILAQTVVAVTMTMRKLTLDEIQNYVKREAAWRTSVGGYYFESLGINLFEKVDGDQSSIIGLPLMTLIPLLAAQGFSPLKT